jgi:hypothetical protein
MGAFINDCFTLDINNVEYVNSLVKRALDKKSSILTVILETDSVSSMVNYWKHLKAWKASSVINKKMGSERIA